MKNNLLRPLIVGMLLLPFTTPVEAHTPSFQFVKNPDSPHIYRVGYKTFCRVQNPDQLRAFGAENKVRIITNPKTLDRKKNLGTCPWPKNRQANTNSTDRSDNTLESLEPEFREKVRRVLAGLEQKNWQPKVAEGRRTREEQAEKFRRGVTRTMNSKHLCGIAADIIDRRHGWGGPAADTNFQFWKDLGEVAKREGLEWGGDWTTFVDVAHIQESRSCGVK
jgi:peptidoglycan L-alanyl-D-glutamate endopeptidase CwlK